MALGKVPLLSEYFGIIVLSLLTVSFLLVFLRTINSNSLLPVNWPVIGMLPGIIANIKHLFDWATSCLRESNRTFVFRGPWFSGMDFVVTCDPANANHIFSTHFENYPKGDDFREIFDILGLGLFNSDGDLWKLQRRMAQHRLNGMQFRSLVVQSCQSKVADGLLPLLSGIEKSGRAIDMQDVAKRFTFDVISLLVLGVDPRNLAPDFPHVQFSNALVDTERVLLMRHIVPKYWWKLKKYFGIGIERRMAMVGEVIEQFIAQFIAKRRADCRSANSDLLSLYLDRETYDLDHVENKDVRDYFQSDRFIRDTLLSFLAAGKETTGASLSWLLYLVSANPNVEKKILKELSQIRSKKMVSEQMVMFESYEEIDSLVYLHAAVCESLRLFPTVPINHKNASNDDVLPSGHKVRAGTMIIFSIYSMGRMESIWGDDCLEFRPERWISADGKLRHEPSYKFLAFNSGPRMCSGMNMALTEIKIAASAIIYNFQMEAVRGHRVEPMLSIVLSMKDGFMVKLRKRKRV